MRHYWLLKSEPDTFSIDDLSKKPKQITHWEGVRNYQARNFLRDEIKLGDQAFFYHSSCKEPGIAGIVEVVRSGYPDCTQFDPESDYYDAKSVPEKPRWYRIDVKLVEKFPVILPLKILREQLELKQMMILQKGNRLSVTPVSLGEWRAIYAIIKQSEEGR